MRDGAKTIRPLPALDETRAPQILDLFQLRATTAEMRDEATRLSEHAGDLHARVQRADLDRRAAQLAQGDPVDLFATIADDLGMSWALVAELISVTPTAVRKWRRGGTMTPENRLRLGHLVAFCEAIPELNPRITDPALWLETPLAATTTLTPAHLYRAALAQQLLDVASERLDAQTALSSFDPHWQTNYGVDGRFEVVAAPDGLPSIVPRT
jgi:hypothetical protein